MYHPDYKHVHVRPLSGAGGAEILDLDIAKGVDDTVFAEVRKALLDFHVIYFRNQTLTDAQFEHWAERFAPLQPHEFVTPVEGHPNMIAVERRPDEDKSVKVVGEDWHADAPWLERPVAGSLLYCLEAPPWGGDTQFCNLHLAYENLSEGLKKALEPLILISKAAGGADYLKSQQGNKAMKYDLAALSKEGEHPLIQIHPETGKRILGVTGPYSYAFKDWTEPESKAVLDMLIKHATRAEHTCRVRWETGTVGIWDNRCTLHQAIKDYQGFGRRMRRLQFAGQRPMGPAMPDTMRQVA